MTPSQQAHHTGATSIDADLRAWREAGFDDALATHCTITGWTLDDVARVLCSDAISACPIDWCYSGLDPLEVHCAVRAGEAAPQRITQTGHHRGGSR